jgi:hypothetical protein
MRLFRWLVTFESLSASQLVSQSARGEPRTLRAE